MLVNNPSARILITSATATNASKFLYEIEDIFTSNALFRWLFDDLIPDFRNVRWNNQEMEIRRPRAFSEASIEAMGVGSAAVSRHFDEQIKDDWVNEDHILYPEQMQKLISYHKHSYSLFVSPARGIDTVIGTRWAHSDLIQHILDNSSQDKLGQANPFAYYCTVRAAIEQGVPIFPINGQGEEEFTESHLKAILADQGPYVFNCQYLNNPTHEDARGFLPAWNRFYNVPPVGLKMFTAIDPATGRGQSRSAVVTIGAHTDRTLWVVEYSCGNYSTDELIEQIIRHWMQYKGTVGMETVVFQKVLMHPLREAMRRYDISFGVRDLRPIGNQKKEFRISGILQPKFANGSIFVRADMEELLKDLAWFPATDKLDLLDALTYAVQMATYPEKEEERVLNPLSYESLMMELEAKAAGPANDLWTWNKSPLAQEVEALLKQAPLSLPSDQAKEIAAQVR